MKKGDKFIIINNKSIELGIFDKIVKGYVFIYVYYHYSNKLVQRKRLQNNFSSCPIQNETFKLLLKDMYNYDFEEE